MGGKASFINFSIGNACNLRCKFCYNDSKREKKQYFEDIQILKDRLINYKFIGEKNINIIGGEPLLYPKIFDLLNFLKENNFNVTIVTNGIKLINNDFYLKFFKYKKYIKYINISIHSHNSILENNITSRNNIFEKKIKVIKRLDKDNFNYFLSLVINKLNIDKLGDIIDFYYNNFSKIIGLQGMIIPNYASDKNLENLPSYSNIIIQFNKLINKLNKITIHWIPLCIHSNINNINYKIRELDKKYLYSFRYDNVNLLEESLKKNYIGNKCIKCYSFRRFCFGPAKKYVEKYGYDEFTSLSKEDVYNLIRTNNYINKIMNKK